MIKNLKYGLKNSSGRNNKGRISSFHIGGGNKNKYVLKLDIFNIKNNKNITVINKNIYDSFSTGNTALCSNDLGHLFYAKIPFLKDNTNFLNYTLSPNTDGDFAKLAFFKKGHLINNLEKFPGSGSTYIRAAGSRGIKLVNLNEKSVMVKLPSGDLRIFNSKSQAFWGFNSNEKFKFLKMYKAGQNRWKNRRPIVRGVAMNPVDHPHGGGEGKTSGGRPSVSPWARLTKGGFRKTKKKK